MKTIGIDIGTTTISLVVMDPEEGRVLTTRTIQNNSMLHTEDDWRQEQDARIIVKNVMDMLDQVVGNYPDFDAIGITGQMHGILYLDEEGHFISPLYTWLDKSGSQPAFDGESVISLVQREYPAMAVAPGYGLVTHLYHVKKGLVPQNAKSICTIMDYLGMRLTGRKKPLMHVSNAASLGFYDVETDQFYTDILEKMGMDISLLPSVTAGFDVLGKFRGIPVTVALGDNQASFLGSVKADKEAVLVNIGTGGQISVLSDHYFVASGIEARPFLKGTYLLVGSSLCGGLAYSLVEKFFRKYAVALGLPDQPQYDVMASLLEAEEDVSPLQVETSFNGTRVIPEKKGAIFNISIENFTPTQLIKGTLQGMADELYNLFSIIEKGTGHHITRLVASGNGVRKNPALQDVLGKKFGVPLEMVENLEESACGAALSAVWDRL